MKVLVTGASGQLGREAVDALRALQVDVRGIDRDDLDFSRPEQVADSIADFGADWVINCAAYTQVDKAEENPSSAFLINRDSAMAVAEGVKKSCGRLLHVSTDFVFGGDQSFPYREDDAAKPLSVYGQSKWEGEEGVRRVLPESIILRTAWVYGVHGNNFVKTILRLAAERDELRVVDDQVGTPSWTADIVRAMWALMEKDVSGVYHFTNEGVASWYDFARQVVIIAEQLDYPVKARRILPIPCSEYPTPAKRPAYSVLSKQRIRSQLGYDIPHWSESLQKMLRDL